MNYKKHEHPTEYKRTYIPYVKAIKPQIQSDNKTAYIRVMYHPLIQ